MDSSNTQNEEKYRLAFKRFNVFMIWMWRLGFGRWINFWPSVVGRIMVLAHTGRVTGMARRTPVNYFRVDDTVYCTAGFGYRTDWYRNILTNPQVEVWLPDGRWAGVAEDISDHDGRDGWLRHVLIASGLAAPMFGVDPHKLGDGEFSDATGNYRLVRIQLTEPRRGPGGPGDLAWVWVPVGVVGGSIVWLTLNRRRRKV